LRINYQIRAQQVRVVSEDGSQLGVKTVQEALALAQEMGKDLVEIAPMATPPVCKIIDFTKLRYEQEKKAREAKKKQKGGHLKEIRMRPNIGEHDLMIKLEHAKGFLQQQDKVRFTIMFKGRENAHRELGNAVVAKIKLALAECGDMETNPFMMGSRLMMSYSPKKIVPPLKKKEAPVKTEEKQ
jgi:translation initiation factor IF-3